MTLKNSGNENFYWIIVACCNYYPDRKDIWVMKENGVKNSLSSPVSLWSYGLCLVFVCVKRTMMKV